MLACGVFSFFVRFAELLACNLGRESRISKTKSQRTGWKAREGPMIMKRCSSSLCQTRRAILSLRVGGVYISESISAPVRVQKKKKTGGEVSPYVIYRALVGSVVSRVVLDSPRQYPGNQSSQPPSRDDSPGSGPVSCGVCAQIREVIYQHRGSEQIRGVGHFVRASERLFCENLVATWGVPLTPRFPWWSRAEHPPLQSVVRFAVHFRPRVSHTSSNRLPGPDG